MPRHLVLAVVCAFALAGTPELPRQSPSWQQQVDKIFAEWDRRDSPGCAVALFKDDAILYERGYGMADLEHNVPITPASVFYAGSVSKQFTAFAAALAIQKGLLGLDDPIRRHLPELPPYADGITIRQLVHHTSGLRDFYTLLNIAGRRQDTLFDNASILRIAARQRALNFLPGDDYLYSNTGYALLATIVGRAAKMTFGEFTDAQIFKPLGMTVSHFGDAASRLVNDRAYGYTRGPKGELQLDTPGGERVGAGGLFTNVRELLRWDSNFYSAKVGGKALVEQVQSPGALNSGKPLTYAWGLQLAKYRGLRVVEHSGALGGYRAHLSRFPDQHFSVASLCNLSSITPGTLVQQIADIVLADRFTESKRAAQRAASPNSGPGGQSADAAGARAPTAALLADAVGVYSSDEIDATFRVTTRDGQLILQRDGTGGGDAEPSPMQPAAAGQFRFRGMTIRFVRSPGGAIEGLLVDAGRVRDIRFDRVQP